MEPIQDYLHAVAARLVRDAPLSDEKVRCAWQMAVGAGLARVSQAHVEADGTIRVTADDTRWRKEIAKGRDVILQRLQATLGPTIARRLVMTVRDDRGPLRSRPATKT